MASRRPPRTLAVDSSSALASAQEEESVLTGVGSGPFASVLRTCVWLWAIRLCLTFSFLDKQWLWADCLRPLRTWPAMGRSPLPDLDYSERTLALGCSLRSAFPTDMRWLWAVRLCPTFSFLTSVGYGPTVFVHCARGRLWAGRLCQTLTIPNERWLWAIRFVPTSQSKRPPERDDQLALSPSSRKWFRRTLTQEKLPRCGVRTLARTCRPADRPRRRLT